jgi:hypothetical protein
VKFYIAAGNRAGLATTGQERQRPHRPSRSGRPLFSLIAVGRRELDPNTLVVGALLPQEVMAAT